MEVAIVGYRWSKLATAISALALVGLTAGSGVGAAAARRAALAPIDIGFVNTLSGPFAEVGQDTLAGAQLAVTQINARGGVLGGHPLKLVVKDEQADPTVTATDVKSLIGQGVKLIAGFMDDSDCLAALPLIQAAGGVMVGTSCQSDLMTTTKFSSAFYEIPPNNTELGRAAGVFAAQHFPGLTWSYVGPNYEFGHEVWQLFQTTLARLNPASKFGKAEFPALTETAFTPYITSILSTLPANSAQNSGLYTSEFGSSTIDLVKQGAPYKFFSRFKAVINVGGSTPTAVAMGASTPRLYFVYDYDNLAYSNAVNKSFVQAYTAEHHIAPDAWAYEGYTAILALENGINRAKSAAPAAVDKAMAGMTFQSPKGAVTFRKQDHLLVSPVTVWEVVGDAHAKGGFRIVFAQAVPASSVIPAPHPS
jgi:branched-chain amino acid transport system substrate-binding protein